MFLAQSQHGRICLDKNHLEKRADSIILIDDVKTKIKGKK